MVRPQAGFLSAVVLLAALATVQGQESQVAPSPYFECPYVNYFDDDCPQLRKQREERERRRLQRQESPAIPGGQEETPANQAKEDGGNPGEVGADTYLLFPKESLAPDAPPLFRLLLAEPSLDNARRYVRWYARRTARLQVVQALIRLAGSELEAETNPGGEAP